MEPTTKFKIERLDEKTARKTDQTESVTIFDVEFLRKQKKELEEELEVKQKILSEVSVIIEEFEKQPVPVKMPPEAEVGEQIP